ncbi:MAG: polyprenyl synthetase family protein [bacterium]
MNFREFSAAHRSAIVDCLRAQTAPVAVPSLRAAMDHLLGLGKLFRPLMALAVARACGQTDIPALIPWVTPLELIHTFTLIHDDLPCMDDASLRRGVPAVHIAFDEALAVLAGDALANYAYLQLASAANGLGSGQRLALIASAARATHLVVEGQVLDLEGEQRSLSLDELINLHRCKTGALFSTTCEFGAILAGSSPGRIAEMGELGREIGLAFQIRDDLLSLSSTDSEMGKTLATDLERNKSTFPRLLGVEGAEAHLGSLLAGIAERIRGMQLAEPDVLLDIAEAAGRRSH